MSSVTGLRLLSQSMLNVSCQKQMHCGSLPTDTLTESPMESVGQARPSGACGLLGVPSLGALDLDVDDDDCEVVIGIRPKSSPLPRRRSSVDEDSEPEPPLSGSRRVSFADAKGLNLVQVKEFDTWDVPKLPGYDSVSVSEGKDAEEYFLSPLTFSLPLPTEELFVKVRDQKVELESIELLPGTTIVKGVIRVLNISFSKAIFIRTTLDSWSSHFDLLAEYIPGLGDSLTDCFSFKLTLVPPFQEQGARVDFCLRYETPVGTFWANNDNKNYVLLCQQRGKERMEKPQRENANKKSCLKTVGQKFSTVEDNTPAEASSHETRDGPQQGEKVDDRKTKQASDNQSATSAESKEKLKAENRRNSSRRNRRKAARMARVRDFFAQRGEETNGAGRDETPAEAKPAAQEESPEGKHSDEPSLSERSSQSEAPRFISESLEAREEPILDVLHDTSPAHDCTSNTEPEKSESINLANSSVPMGGESAVDTGDDPLPSAGDHTPAEGPNINKPVSSQAESSQKQSMCYDCTNNMTAEPAMSSERPVTETSSFTFGTVVAPLYHQVFGKVGSETQSDGGNPADVVNHIYPPAGKSETSCVPADAGENADDDHTHVSQDDKPGQECVQVAPACHATEEEGEEEASLNVTANDGLGQEDPPPDQRPMDSSDPLETTAAQLQPVSAVKTHLSHPKTPRENLNLQGEDKQEDKLTFDLHGQTTADTAQAPLPEQACAQTTTDLDEARSPREPEELEETSLPSLSSSTCVDERNPHTDRAVTSSSNCVTSEEDKTLEAFHEANPKEISNPASKEGENSSVSCLEISEETDVTRPHLSLESQEETNDVAEENKEAMMRNYGTHEDTSEELKEKKMIVSEKTEHHEVEAVVCKVEEVCLADSVEVKNWEMMVEEEEENILPDEMESEETHLKTEDAAGVEKVQAEDFETEMEEADTVEMEQEISEGERKEIPAAGSSERKVTDAEDKVKLSEEQAEETVPGEEREEAEEREKEKPFRDGLEVDNVQEVKDETQEEEEMESELIHGNEASVEREDQIKEEKVEETLEHKEETVEPDTVDSEAEDLTAESQMGCYEEMLTIKQDKDDSGFSATESNMQDEKITEEQYTREEPNALTPGEMPLFHEEVLQHSEAVTYQLSKPASAAEGGSCLFTDEPESDHLSYDSTSAESDSDDEVELYMHCLRAVHGGAQAQRDKNKETGFSTDKRPSVSKAKRLSTPMPSISESVDEDQHFSSAQDRHEDMDVADIQPEATSLSEPRAQESSKTNVSQWTEAFSCRNISKTLLCAILFLLFVAVAYHYDFLACFGLYLISVIWLCCQSERQPVKTTRE
ncbi:uncharacterized protein V6R79_013289 [Siganus canaliculatus]